MRIGIDARFYGSIGKGLGRYTQKLIENLEQISAESELISDPELKNEYFIFLRKENFGEYQPKADNFHKVEADFGWYTWDEQFKFPKLLNRYNIDLVHFPHFNVPLFYWRKFIVTIHDLILLHFPTRKNTMLNPFWYWLKFLTYRIVINSAIKRAQKIIAVSEFTKEDILKNYEISKDKVIVTYESCDNFCHYNPQDSHSVLNKYGIIKPYLLYVGNAYPHKNLERMVLVFSEIIKTEKELHLVLVGKEDYFYVRLKKLVQKNRIANVIFSGFIPDADLDVVYREAELYVFPSLYEGFGLPSLEAMAKGAPVACSDHPCMREILGESALYFDATAEKNMVKVIWDLLKDEELRKEFRKLGYRQTEKFSWLEMARKTLKIYELMK